MSVDRKLTRENSRFSSLFAAREVSRGGTSATQRQKFHTDDVNQCLHNKSGSHGIPNSNLFHFTFLLVDFGKVSCSSANELQQNSTASSTEDYFRRLTENNSPTGFTATFTYRFVNIPSVFWLSYSTGHAH